MKVAISSMVIPVSVIDSSRLTLEIESERCFDGPRLGEMLWSSPSPRLSLRSYGLPFAASNVGLFSNGSLNSEACGNRGDE